jgi:hypothetical protein
MYLRHTGIQKSRIGPSTPGLSGISFELRGVLIRQQSSESLALGSIASGGGPGGRSRWRVMDAGASRPVGGSSSCTTRGCTPVRMGHGSCTLLPLAAALSRQIERRRACAARDGIRESRTAANPRRVRLDVKRRCSANDRGRAGQRTSCAPYLGVERRWPWGTREPPLLIHPVLPFDALGRVTPLTNGRSDAFAELDVQRPLEFWLRPHPSGSGLLRRGQIPRS